MEDKVSLLLGGAADYITKPFNTSELLARIAVQLRSAGTGSTQTLSFDDIAINTSAHSACG